MTRLPVLLLGAALALAPSCSSSGNGPVQKDPPHAFLDLPETHVLGDTMTVNARTNGCDQVTQLTLLNQGQTLKTLSPAGGTVSVFLHTQDLSFAAGIPAMLALSLKVTCNDGRTGVSDVTGASFFPAAKVIAPASGAQAVPDVFYAEGSGANVTFVGCALQPNGTPELVRVDSSGSVVQQNTTLPFPCDDTTTFTDRASAAGDVRWMLTPGKGALGFDANLNVLAVARPTTGSAGTTPGVSLLPASYVAVAANGDGIVWSAGDPPPYGTDLYRVAITGPLATGPCAPNVWCAGAPGARGSPAVDPSSNIVTLPMLTDNGDGSTYTLQARHFDFAQGTYETSTLMPPINRPLGGNVPSFNVTLNARGTTAYIPYNLATGGGFALRSVNTFANSQAHWENASLMGSALAGIEFAGGQDVAAIASERTYLLSATTGAAVASSTIEVTPGLSTQMVQAGKGEDFYLLNGPAQKLPIEIVAVDSPSKGELFRYTLLGGSVALAVDDGGLPWMRIGAALVQPLTLEQYRALRGN